MTPLEQRFCLIGRRIVIAAVQKAYPGTDGMPRMEFLLFAEHDKRVESMTEVVEEVCKLIAADPQTTLNNLPNLVNEWRRALEERAALRKQIDDMHKSGEYAIGKSLVEAIRLANEKSKS